MLGLVLQRALLICWVACVPISVVWSQAHRLLSALGQAPEIVEGASRCEQGRARVRTADSGQRILDLLPSYDIGASGLVEERSGLVG